MSGVLVPGKTGAQPAAARWLREAAESIRGIDPAAVEQAAAVLMGLVTAWGNDTDFDRVFAEQLEVLGRPGDALVIVSVSGSSPNLMALISAARLLGIRTVGLLGRTGGKARDLVDVAVLVPSDDYGWVESAHVVLHHALTYAVREAARAEHG